MIIKSIDTSGRLVIPVDMLRSAGIDRGDSIELYVTQTGGDPAILVKKYQDCCLLCSDVLEQDKFKKIRGKKFCNGCMKLLKKEIGKQDKS